ncbi:hypothetical protein HXX76_003442 [Chlamydomonas incerta]|uniref:Guanylate cyclase domain-containing protein n=1 Tax=Chlamydomonas incerta TaxID=51695 RepID=A0A835TAH7_CHLIN|nr:hypothetical protein HXX76_003442 [Chlamydomonas incerta]|eukprot:KAG2441834.1 hypothetical protein HXX76_003442 [Chlamydomonas incerta]
MLPEHYIRNQFRIASTLPTANESGPYDFWMVSAEAFGMPELNDAFLDTSLLLSNDHDFQWTDIPRFFRFAMSGAALGSYNSIPAALAMTFLYYQPRLFERYNISIPHTWEDVIEVAEKYNGQDLNQDGRGMIGICMDVSQSCGNYGNAVLNILATMIQTRGPTDGVVLDPDTLELLAAGEPLQEALRLFSRLQAVSIPADTPCFGFYTQLHAKGRCLMTIGMPSAFKVASHERFPGPMHGNLGVLLMPGSSRVLDRSSGRLVPCTLELCPYATHVVRPSRPGEEVLVNKVNAFDTASMAINRYKPLHRQAAALRMLSFTFGPIGSKAFALAPTSEAGVLRYSQLDLDDWLAAGYERSNTEAYLAETIKMFDFPNTFIELRFPGTFEVHDQLKELTRSVVWGNASIKAAEDKWVASVRAIVEARGGVRGLGPAYRRSLGIMTISSKFLQMFMEAAANKDSNHDVGEVVAAVVVPVVVVLLLALMAALLYVRRSRRRQQEKQDSTSAPGPGCVVLCVTDIENSTTLWETLPADVCQSAIQLHHSTIRRAADTFKGYESATEGDSFILAFASANDCVRFCLHVQEALGSPETPWPAELLASPLAGVVTLQPPQPSLEQQQSIRAMCGPGILTSLLRHVAPGSDGAGSMAQTAADDQQQVADRLCVFRGLRVRIGFHGGYFTESEVSFNRASQRTVYSGAMARAAKAIGDVGRGGQVMASAHTLATVRPSLLRSDTLLVLHAGRHVIKEDDVADTELYCLYSRALAARAAVVDPPRSHLIKVPGSLAAPLGRLAVALLQVGDDVTYGGLEVAVWLFSLRAWAQERAAGLGGYLLLTGPGTFQAVFTNPLASVEWMLDVQDLVLDRGAGGGTPAADGRASRLSGNSSGGRPSLGPSKKQDQGDTPGNVDMQLSARGGADVGCLQASLTSDGWVTYSGGACKRVACMTARAAWGCALVSVELARQVLGPGDPQLETIEEACIAAGVGDAGGGAVATLQHQQY